MAKTDPVCFSQQKYNNYMLKDDPKRRSSSNIHFLHRVGAAGSVDSSLSQRKQVTFDSDELISDSLNLPGTQIFFLFRCQHID